MPVSRKKSSNKKLSKTREIPEVKRFMDTYSKTLKLILDESNISAFKMLAKDPNIGQNFFTNHQFYIDLLGPNIDLFTRYIRTALAERAMKDVMTAINQHTSAVYPGYWSSANIYVLAISHIRIDEDEEQGFYITCDPDQQAEFVNLEPKYLMLFKDFNKGTLYVFYQNVLNVIYAFIAGDIKNHLPSALYCSKDEALPAKFSREFMEAAGEKIYELYHEIHEKEDLTVQEQGDIFMHGIGNVLIGYMMVLLMESGLHPNAVKELFSISKAQVFYLEESKAGKKIDNFFHHWNRVRYVLIATTEDGYVTNSAFEFSPEDLLSLMMNMMHETHPEEFFAVFPNVVRLATNRIGKGINEFLSQLTVQVMNVTIHRYNAKKTAPSSEETEES